MSFFSPALNFIQCWADFFHFYLFVINILDNFVTFLTHTYYWKIEKKTIMTKWITLEEAAAKYDMGARNIKNWGQKEEITVARIGETWMVDDDSSYYE